MVQVYTEDIGAWSEVDVYSRRILVAGRLSDVGWDFTIGQQAYVDSTPGAFTFTRPTVGHITLLGDATWPNTLRFYPSPEHFYEWVVWEGSAIVYDHTRYIYEFGGDDGDGVHNRLRRLDIQTGVWTELASGCTARRDAAMVWVQGYLYIFGGQDDDGNALSTMCIYSTWTDTWQGPYATSCGARISPVMLPWYNSTTHKWEIHILGGFTESGVVMTTCIYTPDDGDGNTPDEGTPPDDPVPDDFDEGEPPPDGFDDDMDWHPPSSAESDDATSKVNCFSGYDATYKQYSAGYKIGNNIYAIDKDNEEIIEFDADTGTWHNYDSVLSWPAQGITFLEVYDGKIWALSVWNPDEMTGALAMYSWEPGDSAWYHYADIEDPNNNGRVAYAMVLSGTGFYIYYDGSGGLADGYIVFAPGLGGSWGSDVELEKFSVAAEVISDGSCGWTIGESGASFVNKQITPPGTVEDIPGMPGTFSYASLGASSTKLSVAFGVMYDEIEGYVSDHSVRYFDLIGRQWFEYVGTIFQNSEAPFSAVGPRIAQIGNYIYFFVTECDEFGENCSLCAWRFDTTFEAGTGEAAWPVSMSYLTSNGVAGIVFFINRDPSTGSLAVYSYSASPDPVTGKHYSMLIGASGGDEWSELLVKYNIWKALKALGFDIQVDFYFPPSLDHFAVDYSQGPIDPNNPNSLQYVRTDVYGHVHFKTVPGL